MKSFTVLYAEDVPHYAAVEIEAEDAYEAITKARTLDTTGVPTDPDWHNAVSRRIVEVTDEDENIIIEFVPLDRIHDFKR